MAEFYVSVSQIQMADQIATLINLHNKLYKRHTKHSIMREKTEYFVELEGGKVIGCAGLARRDDNLCEVKHVCVHPNARRRGIASKLVKLAIAHSPADYVYMNINEHNEASLKMAQSLGFVYVRKFFNIDHYVITVGRRKNNANEIRNC